LVIATLGSLAIEPHEPIPVSEFFDPLDPSRSVSAAQRFDQGFSVESESHKILLSEIHSAALGVFDKIAKDVGQLKSMSAIDRHAMLSGPGQWSPLGRPDRHTA
jgi:hypothetical protein